MKRSARGQTLVLFALTMLALVVMVCLTLAIGMKAREKVELQTVADSVAYSNAVSTARTYNTIAVWTRAQVSHMVVLAGAQSHISYASWYLATVKAAEISAFAQTVPCGLASIAAPCLIPACAKLGVAGTKLHKEYDKAFKNFKKLDKAAGLEAKMIQIRAWSYGAAAKAAYGWHLKRQSLEGGLDDEILALAVPDPQRRAEYNFLPTGNAVTGLELGPPLRTGARGAWDTDSDPYPALPATHGSRKSAFIRDRQDWLAIGGLNGKLNAALGGTGFLAAYPVGTAHFGTAKHSPQTHNAQESWADDEGLFFGAVFGGCGGWPIPPLPWGTAELRSTDYRNKQDHHRWSPGGSAHDGHASQIHDLGDCSSGGLYPENCPSVWVSRAEFNLNPDNVNANGANQDQWRQPKHMVVLERNYERRRIQDPWNLLFRFRFNPSGEGQQIDIGKQDDPGAGFSRQAVISTGITYYHRHMENAGMYWQEPPNFFNPFWRATLVPPDIDNTGEGDINLALAPMGFDFAAAYNGLRLAGFRGIQ